VTGWCSGGSYVCDAGHELRVTSRCQLEDLRESESRPFEQLLRHEIVEALQAKRAGKTDDTKTVGPVAGPRTLYRLARGHDHRGATWFDQKHNVVWLCGYSHHRSGEPDDAFPYFRGLLAAGRLYPEPIDFIAFEEERSVRLAATFVHDAQELLASARAHPAVLHTGYLGPAPVGVYIEILETLEETYVVLSLFDVNPAWLSLILNGFYPTRLFDDWKPSDLPARTLNVDRAEICYSILHDSSAV